MIEILNKNITSIKLFMFKVLYTKWLEYYIQIYVFNKNSTNIKNFNFLIYSNKKYNRKKLDF